MNRLKELFGLAFPILPLLWPLSILFMIWPQATIGLVGLGFSAGLIFAIVRFANTSTDR